MGAASLRKILLILPPNPQKNLLKNNPKQQSSIKNAHIKSAQSNSILLTISLRVLKINLQNTKLLHLFDIFVWGNV